MVSIILMNRFVKIRGDTAAAGSYGMKCAAWSHAQHGSTWLMAMGPLLCRSRRATPHVCIDANAKRARFCGERFIPLLLQCPFPTPDAFSTLWHVFALRRAPATPLSFSQCHLMM